jgi:hypothetical protein
MRLIERIYLNGLATERREARGLRKCAKTSKIGLSNTEKMGLTNQEERRSFLRIKDLHLSKPSMINKCP